MCHHVLCKPTCASTLVVFGEDSDAFNGVLALNNGGVIAVNNKCSLEGYSTRNLIC